MLDFVHIALMQINIALTLHGGGGGGRKVEFEQLHGVRAAAWSPSGCMGSEQLHGVQTSKL